MEEARAQPGTRQAAAERERRFRAYELPSDRRHSALIALLTVPAGLIFILSDYSMFGFEPKFFFYVAVRSLYGVVGLIAAYLIARARTPELHDRLIFGWLLFLSVVLLGLDATRPTVFTASVLIEVMAIVFIYTATRFPLRLQVIGAAVLTSGSAGLNLVVKQPDLFLTSLAILVALTVSNLLGFLTSKQVGAQRRSAYELLEKEIDARLSLERALDEVQRLRGILPICASCKQIRDESGTWQPVEVYIRDRSEADFTHGLCPICVGDYTPPEGLVWPSDG